VRPPEATSWITRTPDVCGGEACVRDTRHTVYGLVEWKRMGLSDARILEHHPDLTQADLDAAWDYYRQHSEEIDEAIRADAEA
jgi:type III restriction enzyme